MAVRPSLLLLDEPLADLDEKGIAAVCHALESLPDATVLIASPVPLPDALSTRLYAMAQDNAS
jgi:energy-coupling factor transporter ATP-binding protein EcfA2